jgi:rhamnogalacturonyl hydrolase YesR
VKPFPGLPAFILCILAALCPFATRGAFADPAGGDVNVPAPSNPAPVSSPSEAQYRAWGQETLDAIQAELWLPKRRLYADEDEVGQPVPNKPAFMWGCGVQLSALAAAAHLDSARYEPSLRAFADTLQVYWTEYNGIGGFDVLPGPNGRDRYYDDNAWMVLAFADTFEDTGDARYLDRAERTFRFVVSGEDERLGGGIYWHEPDRTSKNTCVNAPATAGALRLYQITKKPEYLKTALRLYQWTNQHLQDTDGLFWDNIKLDGKIEKTKWSYNSALMIRSNCLFHAVTGDKQYLDEAERIARTAESRWIRTSTGAIRDGAAFAHLLPEAFLAVYREDHDRHWTDLVGRALLFLHEKVRDSNGHYGGRWGALETRTKFRLIDQASAARAYWVAAAVGSQP